MRALFATLCILPACDDGGPEEDYYTEQGECEAPDGTADLGATPAAFWEANCFVAGAAELQVVESETEWQALFDCDTAVPAGLDLAAERAAVVTIMCSPTSFRFAAEGPDDVVVGVKTGISGACIGNLVVVPLPRSSKPVRLARCWDQCHGECPPVP